MTDNPIDLQARVRSELHQALDAVPAGGPSWPAVQAAAHARAQVSNRRRRFVALAGVAAVVVALVLVLPYHRAHQNAAGPKPIQTLQVLTKRSSLSSTTSPPIAVGSDAIFAAVWDSGELLRLDPGTLKTTGRLQVGSAYNGPLSLAYGAGSVWVVNFGDNSLWRVDPVTMKRTLRVSLGYEASQVAVGDNAVWVTECCTTTTTANRQRLVKLDPKTGATLAAVKLPGDGETGELAVGAVVAVSSENAPIQVLDPDTLKVRYTLAVACGSCPVSALAANSSGLYVAGTDGVRRYAPGSARLLDTYPDPAGVSAVTAEGGTVWAATTNGLVGLDQRTLATVATSSPLQAPTAAFTVGHSLYVSVYGGVVRLSTDK